MAHMSASHDPHVGKQTARMSARGWSECRLENGIQLGKGMALVTAARQRDGARNGGPCFKPGGWMGNAHDAFSVQRKGKQQQLYGRAANHMGSRRICRLGFSPISAMIAPPIVADRLRNSRHRRLRASGDRSSNFGQAGGDCDSLA
jgi:hypothetical protein